MTDTRHVDVTCDRADAGFRCYVVVGDDPAATHHQVTLTDDDLARLAPGAFDPLDLVARSFDFLLEREHRESILPTFTLMTIARYFPSYASDIVARPAR